MKRTKTNLVIGGLSLFIVCAVMCFGYTVPVSAYSLTITTSGELVANSKPASNGGVGTTIVTDDVNVTSNCRAGYTLVVTGPSDNNLYLDGDSSNNTAGTYFTPVDGLNTLDSATNANKWGYSLTANTGVGVFSAMSNEPNTLKTPSQTANPDSDIDDTTSVYYGTAVDNTILPGSYAFANEGQINYQVVMDATCIPGIQYEANGADEGAMEIQDVEADIDVVLRAPNYSKDGYGFAGWNTRANGTGTYYGPNEQVTVPSTGAMTLYAIWIESDGNLQGWTGCSAMNAGDVTALTDTRDGNVYAVAKLADGNCWMTENLRLNPYDSNVSINATNTNNPTEKFTTTDLAVLRAQSSSWDSCTSYTAGCLDKISLDSENLNRNNEANYAGNGSTPYQWYSYGNYYNWYTATAGNGKHNTKNKAVAGDICPAGWHLPVGNVNGEFAELNTALSNNQNNWRKYPNNFVNSGYKYNTSFSVRGGTGFDWTSVSTNWVGGAFYVYSSNNNNSVSLNSTWPHFEASSVRCIAGQIHTLSYDPNMDLLDESEPATPAPQVGKPVNGSYTFTVQDGFNTTRPGYSFLGWSTDYNANTPEYLPNETITTTSPNTVLYAMWGCDDSATGAICYDANGSGVVGKTYVQTKRSVDSSNAITAGSSVYLTSPNYSRSGYGFAGWNTEPDGSGTNYGSNHSITMPDSNYLHLYAMWIAAEKDEHDEPVYLQDWLGCTELNVGDSIALTDSRDGEVYTVTKLADENCWQTENLRLDLFDDSVQITAANTNNPTQQFMTTELDAYREQDSPWENCTASSCADRINMGNEDMMRGIISNPTSGPWYSYGGYYNWYTATAGNGHYSDTDTTASGDICPAGWHLPSADTGGDYTILNSKLGSVYNATYAAFPNNFVMSGLTNYSSGTVSNTGAIDVWSSTAYSSNTDGYAAQNKHFDKKLGLPVRCVATYPKKSILEDNYSVNGKMKSLAEGVTTSSGTASSKIKAIRRASSLPQNFVASTENTVSASNSRYPIYIFFDNTNDAGIMYYYSDVDIVYVNTSFSLSNNTALVDISGLAELDASKATGLSGLFSGNTSLMDLSPLASWDVSKVKRMDEMFYGCTSLQSLHGLEDWQTDSLEDIYQMFYRTTSLTNITALSDWYTSELNSLSYYRTFAYSGITSLHGLENWDFSQHTNKSGATIMPNVHEMFEHASNLSDISAAANWDMSKQNDRFQMFSWTALTNLHGVENWGPTDGYLLSLDEFWNIATLTDISALADWDVSSKTSFEGAFQNMPGLTNLDGLENWDVSHVENMGAAFRGLTNLADISAIADWNTSSVTNMGSMFYNNPSLVSADALNDWEIGNVTSFQTMFGGTTTVHPTFSRRAGTWDSNGTFTPSV